MYYDEKSFNNDVIKMSKMISQKEGYMYDGIYPVPTGGIAFGVALSKCLSLPIISESQLKEALNPLIVDDLIDSGSTRNRFSQYDFACIHVKNEIHQSDSSIFFLHVADDWVHYWWEKNDSSIDDNIRRILQYIGEDPMREGLLDTPKRVVKAYDFLFSGYKQDPKDLIKVFSETEYSEMVLLKNIEVYSMCEHHMLPFIGKAHVAYIPNKRVIGISKLARIVDLYAKRLQIQERLCDQITECLMTELAPLGAACIIEAQHLCMQMRGVEKQNSVMVTSSLKGVFIESQMVRHEFMELIK